MSENIYEPPNQTIIQSMDGPRNQLTNWCNERRITQWFIFLPRDGCILQEQMHWGIHEQTRIRFGQAQPAYWPTEQRINWPTNGCSHLKINRLADGWMNRMTNPPREGLRDQQKDWVRLRTAITSLLTDKARDRWTHQFRYLPMDGCIDWWTNEQKGQPTEE